MATRTLARNRIRTETPDVNTAIAQEVARIELTHAVSEAKVAHGLLEQLDGGDLAFQLRDDRETRGWLRGWALDALDRRLADIEKAVTKTAAAPR